MKKAQTSDSTIWRCCPNVAEQTAAKFDSTINTLHRQHLWLRSNFFPYFPIWAPSLRIPAKQNIKKKNKNHWLFVLVNGIIYCNFHSTSALFPVLTLYMFLRISSDCSFSFMVNRNFGLSGKKPSSRKLMPLIVLLQSKYKRHGDTLKPFMYSTQFIGMISHAKSGR